MKTAIIVSKKDPAGMNIAEHLKKYDLCGSLHFIEEDTVFSNDLDKKIEADLFIFATRHQSKEKIPSLSCHVPGNWGKAEFGGMDRKLCIAPALFLKNIFLNLSKFGKELGIEITLECTHHGPLINRPAVFIEIGSGEEQWKNKEYGEVIAKTIIESIKCQKFSTDSSEIEDFRVCSEMQSISDIQSVAESQCHSRMRKISECRKAKLSDKPEICKADFSVHAQEPPDAVNDSNIPPVCDWWFLTKIDNNNQKIAFGIGGLHYCSNFNKILLRTNIAISHICPKYQLENLDKEMILQAIDKTEEKVDFVLLDWKGLGKEKQRVISLLEELNLKYKRTDQLLSKTEIF